MITLHDALVEFREYVESVEDASSKGLHVVCDPQFLRRILDSIDAGVGSAISASLGAIIRAQQERDAAIKKGGAK